MQSIEDAFVSTLQSVFPDWKIYTQAMSQGLPDECIMVKLQTMNMGRDRKSSATRRRTIMFDVAVITEEKTEYWVENRLMEINAIKIGEIEIVLTSSRFSRVDGVTHMTGYFYTSELTY